MCSLLLNVLIKEHPLLTFMHEHNCLCPYTLLLFHQHVNERLLEALLQLGSVCRLYSLRRAGA
jgi:hypothetical protein